MDRFPHDMLRYDQCFPLYPSDSDIIDKSPTGKEEIVALGHWGPSTWTPTNGRWRSFHWAVTHHEVMP